MIRTNRFLLTAGAAGATALAMALSGGSADAADTQSFTVTAHGLSQKTVDVGHHGFSAGDYDVHSDRLTRGGAAAGWMAGTCLTTRVTRSHADQICDLELHLPQGQIVARGTVRSGAHGPGSFVLAIAGGTGKFDDATGSLSLAPTNGKTLPVTVNVRY